MIKPILILLTCSDSKEADKISDNLLEKHLVACIKKSSVSSNYLWKGKKEKADEVLLMMESKDNLFVKIEKEIHKLSSYATPVLVGIPILKNTKGVISWLNQELN